jgi:hypothetical protein
LNDKHTLFTTSWIFLTQVDGGEENQFVSGFPLQKFVGSLYLQFLRGLEMVNASDDYTSNLSLYMYEESVCLKMEDFQIGGEHGQILLRVTV